MSKVFLKSDDPRHFLVDSNGDMYEVSKEIADLYATIRPRHSATIDHVDVETNTIWLTSALPDKVKAVQ